MDGSSEQSEKDSKQWVEGSKSQTTDYGTTDNQEAEGKAQSAESKAVKIQRAEAKIAKGKFL